MKLEEVSLGFVDFVGVQTGDRVNLCIAPEYKLSVGNDVVVTDGKGNEWDGYVVSIHHTFASNAEDYRFWVNLLGDNVQGFDILKVIAKISRNDFDY